MLRMLLTYCRNDKGEERLYLTGQGSLAAWIAPEGNGGWQYHASQAPADNATDFEIRKAAPSREFLLDELAQLAGVGRADLAAVPFLSLATLAAPMPSPIRQRVARQRGRDDGGGWRIVSPPHR